MSLRCRKEKAGSPESSQKNLSEMERLWKQTEFIIRRLAQEVLKEALQTEVRDTRQT